MNLEGAFSILYILCGVIMAFLVAAVTLVYQWSTLKISVRVMMGLVEGFGVMFWCVILKLAGIQYKWSEKTIDSWRMEHFPRRIAWKYMERFKLACKPFSLGDGNVKVSKKLE